MLGDEQARVPSVFDEVVPAPYLGFTGGITQLRGEVCDSRRIFQQHPSDDEGHTVGDHSVIPCYLYTFKERVFMKTAGIILAGCVMFVGPATAQGPGGGAPAGVQP